MLAYAFDVEHRLVEDLILLNRDEKTDFVELLVQLILASFQELLRFGNVKEYEMASSMGANIRGRIDLFRSAIASAGREKRWVYTFARRTNATEKNLAILKSLYFASSYNLSKRVKAELYDIFSLFPDLNPQCPPTPIHLRQLIKKEKDVGYKRVLSLCEFLSIGISISGDGSKKNLTADVEKKLLPLLFELFIFNFLQQNLINRRVFRKVLHWSYEPLNPAQEDLLPVMKPDIIVESDKHAIVVDAKYYGHYLSEGYYDPKVRSSHLYQIESYLNNLESHLEKVGVLLYPDNEDFNFHPYKAGDKKLIIATLPIAAHWFKLRDSLLKIVEFCLV